MHRPARRVASVGVQLFAAFVAVAVGGCGAGGPKMAKIAGRISIDGEPVANGYLQFVPQPTGRAPAAGAVVATGSYSGEVSPGKILVLITGTRPTGKMIHEYSQPREEAVSIVPRKYEKGIVLDVEGDDASLNFDLKSK